MKYRIFLLAFILFFYTNFFAQENLKAFQIFDKKGNAVVFEQLVKEASNSDIVFFGELHNNAIAHWLELKLTEGLAELKPQSLMLGAEMFESDNQLILDEYLSDLISEEKFEAECRLWNNYQTDYKPLVNFAKANNIRFIATNVPRRYASVVYKKGFEALNSLSKQAKSYLPNLPIYYNAEQDAYQSMLKMGGMHGRVNENLPKAQAVKDATMAYFINKNYQKKHTLLHFNGAYHSDKYQGVLYYLKRLNNQLKTITITTVQSDNLKKIEPENMIKADYIIVVDESMTKTY